MDKDILLQKIKEGKYDQNKLLTWVGQLPSARIRPSQPKVGDVYIHAIFKHPFILLQKRKDDWLCGLLTSDEDCPEILDECQSRFFQDKYFTKVLFVVIEIKGGFLSVYDNPAHLRKMKNKLFQEFNIQK
jgi:hypothetical protein